ncbi:MAG: AI-2E family transporter [Lachnospiraceae bacterium]|nr:AI-2E family transporter [Lachnospiraceae bacterium]
MKKHSSGASGGNRGQGREDTNNQMRAADSAVRNIIEAEADLLEKPQDEPQKFLKNNKYFTICIYAFVLVVASTVVIRAIILPDQTQNFFAGLIRAVGPFLIALLIAYILMPFVRAVNHLLHRCFKNLPPKPGMVLSILIVYIIAFGLMLTLLVYVLPEVVRNLGDIINRIPQGFAQVSSILEGLEERYPDFDFSSITSMLNDTQSDLMSGLSSVAGQLIPVLYTASVSIVTWLGNFLIAVIVSIYMLYGKKQLLHMFRIVVYAFVPKNHIPLVREIVYDCNAIFSNFVVSKMIDSVIIGILCAILMAILRLPYIFLISVIVGITNMIPYFGPFIGAVPGTIILLVVSPMKAVIFMIMILCLQQFDGLVLGPKLMGNSTGMKPIWIIFAITIGGRFFGVPGMFLGVPAFAILGYLAERYMRHRLRKRNVSMEDIL